MSLRDELKVLSVLYEAARSTRGGEVVMRLGEKTARAFFVGGRIAWVTVSTVKRTFTQYLREKAGLKDEEVQEVFEECRRTKANFGETIVEWGLASEETLRKLLLEHLTECLLEVLSWEAAECMFVPEERTYRGSLTFTLEELLESALAAEGSARLRFAGHSREEIWSLLRSEREPTMPFLPAFAQESPALPKQAAPTAEPPPPAEPPSSPRRGRLGRSLILLAAIFFLAAGSFWLLEYLNPGTQREGKNDVSPSPSADAGPVSSASEPAPSLDAGAAPADEGGSVADAGTAPVPDDDTGARVLSASLQVSSRPAGALVYLDGASTDLKTPCWLQNLTPGEHLVLLERTGYAPAFGRVSAVAGKEGSLRLKLPRRDPRFRGRQTVLVESEPAGASLWLDNVLMKGSTPQKLKLRLDRPSRLTLELEGYAKWHRKVRPVPGEPNVIRVSLEKNP